MRIVVFDTETTSIEKPFVYDIGYAIYDTDTAEILLTRSFVVEQVWHNQELFSSAYYADKRELYISAMRGRTAVMDKIGHITQQMARDFKQYLVSSAYAYNSPFDDNVFTFNCDWFKVKNPFDNIPIFDIRGYVHKKVAFDKAFQDWCESNEAFTESGNYSTTAETVYRFLIQDGEFVEAHTALADALIELDILTYCVDMRGAEYETEYKVYRSVPRKGEKTLIVKDAEGNIATFGYESITIHREKDKKTRIYLRKRVDKTE